MKGMSMLMPMTITVDGELLGWGPRRDDSGVLAGANMPYYFKGGTRHGTTGYGDGVYNSSTAISLVTARGDGHFSYDRECYLFGNDWWNVRRWYGHPHE